MAFGDILIPAYGVLFAGISVASFRMAVRDREPCPIIAVDVASSALLLAGYCAWHLGFHDPGFRAAWRWVIPPVLVVEVWLAVRDLRGLNPDPELSDVENVWIHSIGAWLAVLFSLPAVWFNLRLALGI